MTVPSSIDSVGEIAPARVQALCDAFSSRLVSDDGGRFASSQCGADETAQPIQESSIAIAELDRMPAGAGGPGDRLERGQRGHEHTPGQRVIDRTPRSGANLTQNVAPRARLDGRAENSSSSCMVRNNDLRPRPDRLSSRAV